jgi:hypothetical protein
MHNDCEIMSNSEIAQLRCVLARELVQMHRPEIADIVHESEIFLEGREMLFIPSANSLGILNQDRTEWVKELLRQAMCRAGMHVEQLALLLAADLEQVS